MSPCIQKAYLFKIIVEERKDSCIVADRDLMRHRELLQLRQIGCFHGTQNILAQIMRLQLSFDISSICSLVSKHSIPVSFPVKDHAH